MSRAYDEAIEKMSALPHEEQDRIARWILGELQDEERWTVAFSEWPGKGSHGQLYVGRRRTMVKRTELSQGLLRNMLRDLGIKKEDF